MAALWAGDRRLQRVDLADAAWPLVAAALAVFYANVGGGAAARRSAIAWMIGSWGARLGVYWVWDRVLSRPSDPDRRESLLAFERSAAVAFFFSLPAIFAAADPAETIGIRELAASALWLIGFAGETTADRQLVRWRRANNDRPCTVGLWRYVPRAHDVFELVTWSAHALFASASPFGWIAVACPAAVLYRFRSPGTRRAEL
jgi:steroid 5-alpha reductase family enzyme